MNHIEILPDRVLIEEYRALVAELTAALEACNCKTPATALPPPDPCDRFSEWDL